MNLGGMNRGRSKESMWPVRLAVGLPFWRLAGQYEMIHGE